MLVVGGKFEGVNLEIFDFGHRKDVLVPDVHDEKLILSYTPTKGCQYKVTPPQGVFGTFPCADNT